MRSLLLYIWPFVEVFPCPVAHELLLLELILCCRVTLGARPAALASLWSFFEERTFLGSTPNFIWFESC